MRRIPLSQRKFKGCYALVDDEDYDQLAQWHWTKSTRGYAHRVGKKSDGNRRGRYISLHRQILGVTDPKVEIDHINHNTLDNRKSNLRICSRSQNMANQRLCSDSTSKVKGVSWYKPLMKWRVQIKVSGTKKHIGYFDSKYSAALAYNKAAKKHFGVFALLNEVKE